MMLITTILMPVLWLCSGVSFSCFVDKTQHVFIQNFGLFWSLIILNARCGLLFFSNPTVFFFQFLEVNNWFSPININCIFGIDSLAAILIILTAFLILAPININQWWHK